MALNCLVFEIIASLQFGDRQTNRWTRPSHEAALAVASGGLIVTRRATEILSTSLGTVERVATFKLLGIHLDINLSWSVHINGITSKASKRLYFLKQLKRAGVPQNQLLHFYTAVIRPVLEYAAPVWITSSTALRLSS